MSTMVMTDAQWKRLAELRERLRARDERERKQWAASNRRIRYTAGDERFYAYAKRPHPQLIGVDYAAKFLRIPVDALLAAAGKEDILLDFGRGRNGPLRFFKSVELARFAASQARGASTEKARPRMTPRLITFVPQAA